MRPERALFVLAAGALLAKGAGVPAAARDLPYGAVTSQAVQRCDALNWSRAHAEAAACYRQLARPQVRPADRAEGLWALGDLRTANEAFRTAVAAAPADARLRVRWGELYMDSHQAQQALALFKEALQRDPHDDYARVDAATVLADDYQSAADDYLQPVLTDAAAAGGARLRALLLAARVALEDGDTQQCQQLLDRAAGLAASAQLPLLQLDALRAALATALGQDGSPWSERARAADPAFGEAYAIPARVAEGSWRESTAIALYRQAVSVQPDLWSARAQLASCLLREDRLDEAARELQLAYAGDPYDPVTVNTLRLLDSLRQFAVLHFGAQADHPPAVTLRLSATEMPVLAPYARRLAQQALQYYGQRYRFTPQSPVVLEIFPNHDDLAVRTAGLPGMGGELGVTFGYVVAMDSPMARPLGTFDWGSTLWHELAHVFTLESTDFRVPRWLTEGLSVYEEWTSGPARGKDIPDYAWVALAQGKALPISQLDRGFVRPQYPEQLVVSYTQAALVCDLIERQFGFDRLRALLHAFSDTSDVNTALQRSLGISAEQLDERFRADLQLRYGAFIAHLKEWQTARRETADAAARADWAAVVMAATHALQLLPEDIDEGSPYLALAEAYGATHQPRAALATLRAYWQYGGYDPQALRRLAEDLYQSAQRDQAIAVLDRINSVAPFDVELHGRLGDWLLEAGRANDALAEFRIALALQPADEANAHLRLARAQFALHALPEARREVLAALEIAPNFAPAQRLLLQLAGPLSKGSR